MASKEAEYLNQLFQSFPKDPPGKKHDYAAERAGNAARPLPPVPENIHIEDIILNSVDGEVIRPEKENGKVILYIHGGGMTTGSAKERRDITVYLANKYGFTVYANNYRLSPENKWPAQLDDCMQFYYGMLDAGVAAENLYFMGESAGGTLVLSAALRAKDEGRPVPAGIAAFSPGVVQGIVFPSHTENISTDYMLGDALTRPDQSLAVTGLEKPSEELLKDPYFSPYYGDYEGLPKIFLAASDYEVLYDDAVMLNKKLQETGHPVKLDIAHGLIHAYPMFAMIPEAQETIENAVKFLI